MSMSKKRPTFLRLVISLLLGALISGGILFWAQPHYQAFADASIFSQPFLIIAGIAALVIALFLFIPAQKPLRLFKWLFRIVILAVVVALIFGLGGFYVAQDDFIYMEGRREINAEAALAQNPQVEEVLVKGEKGEQYQGYVLKSAEQSAGLILYFGGNGELAAGRIHTLVRDNAAAILSGLDFMMIDYPGYGQSQGKPSEDSVMDMARAAYAAAKLRAGDKPLVLAGWSLGTGAATALAEENLAAGLVLMAPFYNGTELVNSYIQNQFDVEEGLFSRVPTWLVRNKYENDERARETTIPVLVLGGKQDSLIPVIQAENLSRQYANAQLELLEGGHTAPWSEMQSFQSMAAFLRQVVSAQVLAP
ncbi:MAG: alpha/beta fold hydrolase [Clostridiales bacterium]|nr:alpha/beta fold hydrolase [Clostridiales bacterium]